MNYRKFQQNLLISFDVGMRYDKPFKTSQIKFSYFYYKDDHVSFQSLYNIFSLTLSKQTQIAGR